MNILRRLPLSRLLLLCSLVVVIGVSATALALAVDSGPVPSSKPLAQAIHDALAGPSVEGVTASVTLTDHLLEGASLSGAGGLASSPLLAGASGRLWIAKDGHVRLELQASGGDTQILYDGHTVRLYDAATNTLYRYTPKDPSQAQPVSGQDATVGTHAPPSVAKIEEAITHAERHDNVSGATPTDIGGQPAYSVRISPKEGGSLFGGVELAFDAVQRHTTARRHLLIDDIRAGDRTDRRGSLLRTGQCLGARIQPAVRCEGRRSRQRRRRSFGDEAGRRPAPEGDHHGHGLSSVEVLESSSTSKSHLALPEGLPKVEINGVSARRVGTSLGTVLSFERSGVRYLLLGSVAPAAIEAVAEASSVAGAPASQQPPRTPRCAARAGPRARQALRRGARRRPHRPERQRRRRVRLPRSQRRGQDDHAAHGARADHAERGDDRAVRARSDAPRRAGARGRRGIRGGAALLSVSERPQEPGAVGRTGRGRRRERIGEVLDDRRVDAARRAIASAATRTGCASGWASRRHCCGARGC